MSVVETQPAIPRAAQWTVWRRNVIEAVPRLTRRRDTTLPLIIGGSLLLHGAAIVCLFLAQAKDTQLRPQEIPVEIIQLPPKPEPKAARQPAARAAKSPPPAPAKPASPEPPKAQPKPLERQQAKAHPKPQPKPREQPQPKGVEKQAKAEQHQPAPKPQPPQESVAERMKDLLGPFPSLAAAALPGESADGTEEVSYTQIVMSRIAKAKKEGRYPGIPGYASVSFALGDHGEVTKLELVRPSGDPSLDTEAMALIKRAEPYPPPPPGGRRNYVVTLQFRPMP